MYFRLSNKMYKKVIMRKIFLLIITILLPLFAFANDTVTVTTIEGVNLEVFCSTNRKMIRVIDYNLDDYDYSGDLTIPDQVELGGMMYDIIQIGMNTFSGETEFYGTLSMGDAVQTILTSAFQNTSFIAVNFGSGLKTVQSNAFMGCTAIGNISISAVAPPRLLNPTTAFEYATLNASSVVVNVPSSSATNYMAADGWKEFNDYGLDIVKFIANGSNVTGSVDPIMLTPGSPIVLPDATGFTHALGYTCVGWATSPNATIADYSAGASVTFHGSVTLYAVWAAPTIITFNGKGNTGGVMNPQMFQPGVTQTLTKNTFVRDGYIFSGWTSDPNGTVVEYLDEYLWYPSGNKTLFAIWKRVFTVSFEANGGTGVMADMNVEYGDQATLGANQFSREGYTFIGWSDVAGGEVKYNEGQIFTPSKDLVLYAAWKVNEYTVELRPNGSPELDRQITYQHGISKALPDKYIWTGKTFKGWGLERDGEVVYTDKQVITVTSDLVLYAIWEDKQVTVTFKGNNGVLPGGEVTVDQMLIYGVSTPLTPNEFVRGAHKFKGWATNEATANNGTVNYVDGALVSLTTNIELYAVWEQLSVAVEVEVYGNTKILGVADFSESEFANASKIKFNGKWVATYFDRLKAVIGASKATLTEVDMSAISVEGAIVMDGMFTGFEDLKTVTFPDVNVTSDVKLNATFSGCKALVTLNNLDNLKGVSDFRNTFVDCNLLSEVRIGTDPNTISNIANTFNGAANCLKYLPEGVITVPSAWQGYSNFVVPVTAVETITAPAAINSGEVLVLPSTPTYTPEYAAINETAWLISKTGDIADAVEYTGQILGSEYNGAKLLYGVTAKYQGSIAYSNSVDVTVNELLTDLVINSGETKDANAGETFDNVTVNAGGVLNVAGDVDVNMLKLHSTQTEYYNIKNAESVTVNNGIEFVKTIDKNSYYYFSVPFDIDMADVKSANTHIGDFGVKWILKEYSENLRATNGTASSAWVTKSTGTLKANTGYIARLAASVSGSKELQFPKLGAFTMAEGAGVSVVATSGGVATDRGWNMISVPYYAKGQYKLMYDTVELKVLVPVDNGNSDYRTVKSSEYVFRPSESFFVQVPSAGTVTFQQISQMNAPQKVAAANEFVVSLSDTAGVTDEATIVMNAEAPRNEYYILYDLEKMTTYGDEARIFIADHGTKLVYSALNPEDYTQVSVGVYVPEAGDYTIHFEGSEGMILYDAVTDMEINVPSYTFTADESGFIEGRFFVNMNVSQIPTLEDSNKDEELCIYSNPGEVVLGNLAYGSEVYVYTASGALVAQENPQNTSCNISLPAGLYLVNVINGENNNTYKVTVK